MTKRNDPASERSLSIRRGTSRIARMQVSTPPVVIREVGLRDGLQSLARTLPTAQKLEWIRGAHAAGLREIEVGSFVPPRLLPQLADTAELVAFATTLPGLVVSVLVPNLKGAERAIESGAHSMLLPLSASHAHSLANLRKTPDDVVAEIATIRAERDAAGSELPARGRDQHRVRLHHPGPGRSGRGAAAAARGARRRRRSGRARRHRRLRRPEGGATNCSSAASRSPASGSPAGISTTRAGSAWPTSTRRWQAGVRRFDACLGGIGGCPHAPGASGNVATEDLAYLFASMGEPTGLDFDALLALRARLAGWLRGRDAARRAMARRPAENDAPARMTRGERLPQGSSSMSDASQRPARHHSRSRGCAWSSSRTW